MKVPFVNLGLQYKNLKREILNKFDRLSSKGDYILGEELSKFEDEFAHFCGTKYALGLGNGSDGLSFSLKFFNIGRGDEVILPGNSFVATAWSIVNVGAKPIFVDVLNDLNIDPNAIEKVISKKTKAIIPVHLTGRIADMKRINKIANKYKLKVIEDSAQACGAKYHNQKAGSFGHVASFSLHPLKNLHVHGDGGIVTTNSKKAYEYIKKIRNHGLRDRDNLEKWGYNSRLDNINAGIARIKLRYLNKWNKRVRKIAFKYNTALTNKIIVPTESANCESVYHRYVIISKNRNKLKKYLKENNIDTAINYPIPLHHQEAYRKMYKSNLSLPNVENLSNSILSLPIYNELTDQQVDYVIEKLNFFYK